MQTFSRWLKWSILAFNIRHRIWFKAWQGSFVWFLFCYSLTFWKFWNCLLIKIKICDQFPDSFAFLQGLRIPPNALLQNWLKLLFYLRLLNMYFLHLLLSLSDCASNSYWLPQLENFSIFRLHWLFIPFNQAIILWSLLC